jgi:hypothetical protein
LVTVTCLGPFLADWNKPNARFSVIITLVLFAVATILWAMIDYWPMFKQTKTALRMIAVSAGLALAMFTAASARSLLSALARNAMTAKAWDLYHILGLVSFAVVLTFLTVGLKKPDTREE